MTNTFDTPIDRRGYSAKWDFYAPDVIPLWVADMDFRSPEPVIQALQGRVEHGTFGYDFNSPALKETIVERMASLYNWEIKADEIVFLPGLAYSLGVMCKLTGEEGTGVLMQTPVYHPFLQAVKNNKQILQAAELTCVRTNGNIRYEIDFDAFERTITPETRLFLMCSPHNPVGRVWSRAELERLAEICLRHNVIICSDEIHCDLLMEDKPHIPIASLSPEVAQNTITMMAPSKTFNLPGLGLGFAIIQNAELLSKLKGLEMRHEIAHVTSMGITAALAAYREGQAWLDELLPYLRENRDTLTDYFAEHFPNIPITSPEGTYLAWMDIREAGIPATTQDLPGAPNEFFLNQAKVAVQEGKIFGQGGEGFLRLNYGCRRETLLQALERMRVALEQHRSH
jgi:cysteine-S-conjugate beta-lyase